MIKEHAEDDPKNHQVSFTYIDFTHYIFQKKVAAPVILEDDYDKKDDIGKMTQHEAHEMINDIIK